MNILEVAHIAVDGAVDGVVVTQYECLGNGDTGGGAGAKGSALTHNLAVKRGGR